MNRIESITNLTRRVAKTLPISYYTKSTTKINVVLDEEGNGTSYIDLKKKEIHISLANIINSLKNVKDEDVAEQDTEMYIRSELYHELGHAMMTPTKLFDYIHSSLEKNVVNIMEDERLETVLKDYFIGIDFKKSIMDLCEFTGQAPKSATDYFFHVVRFRHTDNEEHLRLVREFIDKWDHLKGDTFQEERQWWATDNESRDMVSDMMDTFKKIVADWMEENEPEKLKEELNNMGAKPEGQDMTNNVSGGSDDLGDYSEEDKQQAAVNAIINSGKGEDMEPVMGDGPTGEGGKSWNDMTDEEKEAAQKEALENAREQQGMTAEGEKKSDKPGMGDAPTLKAAVEKYDSKEFEAAFDKLFSTFDKRQKKNQDVYLGWQGKFNPRALGKGTNHKTWKAFEKPSPQMGIKGKDSINLICVQDISGSYSSNDTVTNKIFNSLDKMEQRYGKIFGWNLITVNNRVEMKAKNEHIIQSGGGTSLDPVIYDYIKELEDPRKLNIYVALFDGGCFNGECFGALNKDTSVIIDSGDNENDIKRYAPKATMVITRDFTGQLFKELIKNLDKFLR